MNRASPSITVLISVYNGEKYLREAIDSILSQTYADFELLIIDDGSTDGSADIVLSYRDDRITLEKNEQNLGLERSLNKGIHLAKGHYIARMDSDDISLPTRLEKQNIFMDDHPDVALCGTQADYFGAQSKITTRNPVSHEEIRARTLFRCPILHPTAILRKSSLLNGNLLYDLSGEYKYAEEYELWARILEKHQVHNIDEVLLKYRIHESNIGQLFPQQQVDNADKIRHSQLTELGIAFSNADLALHSKIARQDFSISPSFLNDARDWLVRMSNENKRQNYVDSHAFDKELARHYWRICSASTALGLTTYSFFTNAAFNTYYQLNWYKKFKLFIRCAVRQQNWHATG